MTQALRLSAFAQGRRLGAQSHAGLAGHTLRSVVEPSLARELIDGGAEQRLTEMSDAEILDLVRLDIHKACGV